MTHWTKVLVTTPEALPWISVAHTAKESIHTSYPPTLTHTPGHTRASPTHKRNVKRNVNGVLILQHILIMEG